MGQRIVYMFLVLGVFVWSVGSVISVVIQPINKDIEPIKAYATVTPTSTPSPTVTHTPTPTSTPTPQVKFLSIFKPNTSVITVTTYCYCNGFNKMYCEGSEVLYDCE